MHVQLTFFDLDEVRAAIDAVISYRAAHPAPTLSPVDPPTPVEAATPTAPPARRGRKPKSSPEQAVAPPTEAAPEVEAAAPEPAPEVQTSFLDDEPAAPPAKTYTKDDVRAALVALQLKRAGQYRAKGMAEREAAAAAEASARKVLTDVGKTEKLGTLAEDLYGAVVEAANAAAGQGV